MRVSLRELIAPNAAGRSGYEGPVAAERLLRLADRSGDVAVPVRPTSSTPAQSLFFLNNPLPKWMADRFADRLLKMDRINDEKRVEMAYLIALGRSPSSEIVRASLEYIAECESSEKLSKADAWSRFCATLYGTAEFRWVE